jgi:hypothetical protein
VIRRPTETVPVAEMTDTSSYGNFLDNFHLERRGVRRIRFIYLFIHLLLRLGGEWNPLKFVSNNGFFQPSSYAAVVLAKNVKIFYEFQFHKPGLSIITVTSH